MKISRNYTPITITLDTKEELDALTSILNYSAIIYPSIDKNNPRIEPFSAELWGLLTDVGGKIIPREET